MSRSSPLVSHASESFVLLACGVVIVALLVPVPAWVLDLALVGNLAASLALLVGALFTRDALQAASFPGLLMLTTLLRVSLCVSSMRLALTDGHAGEVIQAFGDIVARGDAVVGTVLFVVLTFVQFFVVARGAERVAEVAARFTLDAMPGKQMSIDADLRSGVLGAAEAQSRRRQLEREAQLFGAMDGAMKFVKGDAIAGVVVACVNLVAGSAVGILREGLPLGEALSNFALLAIGDGLASLVPSLCVAVAAGLVVTRVGTPEGEAVSLGAQLAGHFVQDRRGPWTVAAMCVVLGLLPGMPGWPFLAAAAGMGMLGLLVGCGVAATESDRGVELTPADGGAPAVEVRRGRLVLDLGTGLESWGAPGSELQSRVLPGVREGLLSSRGVPLPPVLIRVGVSYLQPGGYALLLDGVPLCRGQVTPGHCYVAAAPAELALLTVKAEKVTHPVNGQPASRVDSSVVALLESADLRPQSACAWMGIHLLAQLGQRASLLVGVQEVQMLLDEVDRDMPVLVRELNRKVPLPVLVEVFKRLVQEELSIRQLEPILEELVSPAAEGDAAALAERCRAALRRQISHRHAPGGSLFAWLLDPSVEEALRVRGEGLDPAWVGQLIMELRKSSATGHAAVLVSPDVRRALQRLCEGTVPGVSVLTYGELESSLQIRPLGRISVKGSVLAAA